MPQQSNNGRQYADEGEVIASLNGIRELIAGNRREYVERFERLDEACARVEAQAKQTNGRVKALELWKAFATGALAVLGLLVSSGVAWITFFGIIK